MYKIAKIANYGFLQTKTKQQVRASIPFEVDHQLNVYVITIRHCGVLNCKVKNIGCDCHTQRIKTEVIATSTEDENVIGLFWKIGILSNFNRLFRSMYLCL